MVRERLVLTFLWWVWGVVLIIVFTVISALGSLFEEAAAGLEWLLPNVMPTMTLVGAATYAQRETPELPPQARRPLFLLAFGVSTAYLIMLTAPILMLAYTSDPIRLLLNWNLGLGPLQAVSTSILGLFFLKKD